VVFSHRLISEPLILPLGVALDQVYKAESHYENRDPAEPPCTRSEERPDALLYIECLIPTELNSPFDRLSPHLFTKVLSFCDAISLVEATGVCKSWKKEIDASSEPSRVFEMKVEGDQLAEGIEALNRRSRNSVQAVILKVENKLNQSEKNRLGGAISISSQSLKTMTIHHQGDLCKLVVEIAERCPNLKVLCSYRLGFENTLSTPSDRYGVLSFSPSWTASLETYCWKAGVDNLKCDPALLEHLRHAKDFTISSRDLTSRCIVELLSSNSDLADVKLRGGKDEAVETIPTMPLTNLETISMGFPPRSAESKGLSTFFAQLDTPNLRSLQIFNLGPDALAFLPSTSSPKSLSIATTNSATTNLRRTLHPCWLEL